MAYSNDGDTVKGANIKIYGDHITLFACDCNELTSLDVSNGTSLTKLNCSCNKLTSLDLTNNAALERLYCGSNQLTGIDVSTLTDLRVLSCSGNQLTTISVSSNSLLEELNCIDNQLTTLNLANNPALTMLCCDENKLTTLNVSNNTSLTTLNCIRNQLTEIDVSNLTALQQLACFENRLTALNVSNNTALTELMCGDNLLTTLDLSNNTALTGLSCDGNQLTTLDLSLNTELTWLVCEKNQLSSLDLSNNTLLTDLRCSNNRLTSFILPAGFFENELEPALFCFDNQLTLSFLYGIDWSRFPDNSDPYNLSYIYVPQTYVIPSSVSVGAEIDLSSEYCVDGTVTQFTWYDAQGNVVTPATADGGVFTFGDDAAGKTLTCKMTNAKLPDFKVSTYTYYEDYDEDGNGIGEEKNGESDDRFTTTEVKILGTDSRYLSVKAGVPLDLAALFIKPDNVTGTVTWSSSNRAVATVDGKGAVKTLAGGTTTVKARCGSYLQSFIIDVEDAFILNKYALSFTRTTARSSPISSISAKKPDGVNTVVWRSDNPSVVTVSDSGAVKAVGAGTANLYCEDAEGHFTSAPCVVTVEDFIIASEGIRGNAAFVLTGDTLGLALDNSNHGAVSWKSSDTRIASIDSEGNVTAKKKGTVTISATAADKKASDSIKLNVVQPTESVTISGVPQILYAGSMASLKAILTSGSNDKVFWSSSDESVATVDATGKIKGISQGEITVTATTFSGRSSSVSILVRTKATALSWVTTHPDMSISKTVKFGMKAGETLDLAIRIDSPVDCNDNVKWTISNKKTATVEPLEDGRSATVTGIAQGTAVITVKTGSGKALTATVSVVTVPAASITLNKKNISLYEGSAVAVSAKLAPKGCNDAIIWRSSDPEVVTVNENGVVKGIIQGTATITAYSSADGSIKDTAEIVVRNKATKLEWTSLPWMVVSKEYKTFIPVTESRFLSIVMTGGETCNDTLNWTTSNPKVATVTPNSDGVAAQVTGLAKGTAVITVKSGSGKKLTARVTVGSVPATEIILKTHEAWVYEGSTVKLSASKQTGSDDVVMWSSSEPDIASVDENGTVKGLKQGTATITAYSSVDGSIKDTAEITVRGKAKKLALGATDANLAKDEEQTVYVSLAPADCNDTVTWSISDKKIASIVPAPDGRSAVIKGIAKGSAVVTVKTGSGKKATVKVVVVG